MTGHGVLWAGGEFLTLIVSSPASRSPNDPTGDVHKRHRKAMAPAFGAVEVKGLLPCFMESVTKARELCFPLTLRADSDSCRQMVDKWTSIIENGKSGNSATIDVNMWFGKATLDACVLISALGVREPRPDCDPVSRKDRCWCFRL